MSKSIVREVGILDQPLDLRPGEIGVDHQARPLADERLVPLLSELVAAGGRAAVLPDERAMDGLACVRVPGDHGLALVGDPDPLQVRALNRSVGEGADRHVPGHLPDLGRVVLHPARFREMLLELAV
jgi:hypothetical protein